MGKIDFQKISNDAKGFVDGVKEKYNLLVAVQNAVVGLWNAIKSVIDNIKNGKKKS